MRPGSTTTTPFSVKDILRLDFHDDYESDFLMTDQVVPMHHHHHHHHHDQPVRAATQSDDFYECRSEGQQKVGAHSSGGERRETGETRALVGLFIERIYDLRMDTN